MSLQSGEKGGFPLAPIPPSSSTQCKLPNNRSLEGGRGPVDEVGISVVGGIELAGHGKKGEQSPRSFDPSSVVVGRGGAGGSLVIALTLPSTQGQGRCHIDFSLSTVMSLTPLARRRLLKHCSPHTHPALLLIQSPCPSVLPPCTTPAIRSPFHQAGFPTRYVGSPGNIRPLPHSSIACSFAMEE